VPFFPANRGQTGRALYVHPSGNNVSIWGSYAAGGIPGLKNESAERLTTAVVNGRASSMPATRRRRRIGVSLPGSLARPLRRARDVYRFCLPTLYPDRRIYSIRILSISSSSIRSQWRVFTARLPANTECACIREHKNLLIAVMVVKYIAGQIELLCSFQCQSIVNFKSGLSITNTIYSVYTKNVRCVHTFRAIRV